MSKLNYTNSTTSSAYNKETDNFLDTDLELINLSIKDVKNRVNKFSFFTSLSDIGLVEGSETIEDIVNNLPQYSKLVYHKITVSGNSEIYPKATGLLTVIKGDNTNRVKFEFSTITDTWIGFYDKANVSPIWTGWKKVLTGFGDIDTISIDSLDLPTDCTLEDIIKAMPRKTQLYFTPSSTYTGLQLPASAGVLFIHKDSNPRTLLEFTQSQNGYDRAIQTIKFIANYDSIVDKVSNWSALYQSSGDNSNRPASPIRFIGMQYFDITLNKPIWWNGSDWIDFEGKIV